MDERPKKRGPIRRLFELLKRKPAAQGEPGSAAPNPVPQEAPPAQPSFSLDKLARRLYRADNPAAALVDFTESVEKRLFSGEAVAPIESFLAHAFTDAGVGSNDVALPALTIVRPRTSGMFYIRLNEEEVPYLALLHVLGIEAALNAAQFATEYFGEEGPATEAEVWQLAHRVPSSVISQMSSIEPLLDDNGERYPDGEWATRAAISAGIESFRLPWRLSARFRINVAAGEAAFECDLAPLRLMWRRASIDGVHVVPATPEMQRRSANDYNARLAILLAACAFRASERIERVWVAGVIDTAHHHSCLYSVCFDRARFEHLTLDSIHDPVALLVSFGARIDANDGMLLAPIQQSFSLDDARFCPPERYDPPEISSRMLPEDLAAALGTPSVSGLAIDEAGRRSAIARDISRSLGTSTAENVSTILRIAGDDPDPTVRAAAERTVEKLIEGSIPEDVFSITREFTEGDSISAAVAQARTLLEARDIDTAEGMLGKLLEELESTYADSPSVVWRVYTSYVDRAFCNRLGIDTGKTVLLAPTAYLEALLMHSLCLLLLGRHEESLDDARHAQKLAPLNAQAQLHTVQCLEAASKTLEAVEELKNLLAHAHDAMGIGFGYYRMAFFQWQLGEVECAQACYLRAIRFLPTVLTLAAPELQVMALQGAGRLADISDEAVDALLEKHGIPVAPTRGIGRIFFEAMRAALDAEIFPVAKSFLLTLGTIERDDVFFGVLRSLEDEPDR